METELIPHQTISAIVENVNQAKLDVAEGCRLLQAAIDRLCGALGDGSGYYHHLTDHQISSFDLARSKDLTAEMHRRMNENAWRYLIDQVGIKNIMTPQRRLELERQFESHQLPELTVENALGTLCGLAGRSEDLLLESMRYVFDWLRPPRSELKTNDPWKIGPKVIVSWACESNYRGGFSLRSSCDADFRALGNVFSLLDGKGVQHYPNDLYSRFQNAMWKKERGESYDDEYFQFKCFKNGRVHIVFKRHDLLDKLNQIASDRELPGQRAA